MRPALFISLSLFFVACGGNPPPVAEAPSSSSDASSAASDKPSEAPAEKNEPETLDVPTACAEAGGDECTVPKSFAKKLCEIGHFPDLALHLFSQPQWTRAYVNIREAAAWNALGGPASDQKLFYDEEVLILIARKPKDMGGMQVSGAGASYDFLRWDGTCASLQVAEMTLRKPPKPKNPDIRWRILEDATQEALLSDEKLAKLVTTRKRECKGATMGNVSDKCEKADRALAGVIAEVVRKGASVPKPAKLP